MTSTGRLLALPRYDETLYSALARVSSYLGDPPRARLHAALLGEDVSVFDDLPVGVGRVVASGVLGPADVDGAVHEWTMFPYYAAFAPVGSAREAARRMEGSGGWPHEALGCGTAAPPMLRFCQACRTDMLEQRPDAWWRRTHQAPSTLVCPDHGDTLLQSRVTRERRRSGYVGATGDECPDGAPVVAVIDGGLARNDLLALARGGDALLDGRCDVHPDDRREGYLGRLAAVGMLNRAGEAKLGAVATAVDGRWGRVLWHWPELARDGRCRQRWLGALLMGAHGGPPLHHLLLDGAIAWVERRR